MAIGSINPVRPAAGPALAPPVTEPSAVGAVLGRLASLARIAANPAPPGPPAADGRAAAAGAVARAVQAAAPRQGGLAPLFADLATAVDSGKLPPPVRDAAIRLLGLRAQLTPSVDAAALRAAVARSGLFLEATLAAHPPATGAPAPPDLKAALLEARQALLAWVQRTPPPALAAPPAAPTARGALEPPPPPFPNGPLAAQPPVAAALTPATEPRTVAQRLLSQTEAALARQELMQAASLPAAGSDNSMAPPGRAHWMFEIPFLAAQGSAVAAFEIDRDGGGAASDGGANTAPSWRARFALDVEPFGPIQAEIVLSAGRAGVRLWAEDPRTALQLRGRQDLLMGALEAAAYSPEVAVLVGAPPQPEAPSGQFLDQSS